VKAPSGASIALTIVLRDIRKRRAISRIERFWTECARRIRPIVSTRVILSFAAPQ
jgi:hypothetical protein